MKLLSFVFKASLITAIAIALYRDVFPGGSLFAPSLLFFTIESNLLVLLSLLLFVAFPKPTRARCLLRGAALLAITLTGIIYNFVMYDIFSDWGPLRMAFREPLRM